MRLPNEHRIAAWQQALIRILTTDPWVVAGGLIGLVAVASVAGSGTDDPDAPLAIIARVAVVLLAVVALGAVLACRKRSAYSGERRFWTLVAPAQAAFLAAQIVTLLSPDRSSGPAGWSYDLTLGLFFALMIPAAEVRPDRRRSADTTRLDALWVLPAAALFVGSLLIYFPGVAHWRGGGGAQIEQQTLLLFSTLAAFLTGRFLLFGFEAGSLRWRLQYWALAVPFAAVLVGAWLPAIGFGGSGVEAPAEAFASWSLAVAAAFNRLSFAGSGSRKPEAGSLDLSGAHRSTTLLWTLTLPFLHVLLHRLGILPETHRELREGIVLTALVALGGYAVLQRYWVELETVGLWLRQRETAHKLRSSEQDLRILVERQRGFRELEQSEKKFAAAFRLNPDGMMITSLEDGEVVDVNHGFCRLFETEPEALIGRKTVELGFWPGETERDAMLKEVLTRGALRDLHWQGPAQDEAGRYLSASFELIHTGNERLLLTIARDQTGPALLADSALLSPKSASVFAVDGEQRLTFWSRSAERLFGRERRDVLERPAPELKLPNTAGRRPSKPTYRARAATADSLPLRLTCHSASVSSEDGELRGRLVFAAALGGEPAKPSSKEPRG